MPILPRALPLGQERNGEEGIKHHTVLNVYVIPHRNCDPRPRGSARGRIGTPDFSVLEAHIDLEIYLYLTPVPVGVPGVE